MTPVAKHAEHLVAELRKAVGVVGGRPDARRIQPSLPGSAHPDAAGLDSHDGAAGQLLAVPIEDLRGCGLLVMRTDAYEADNARMGVPEGDRKLPKVLVERDQDTTLLVCPAEDLLIARVHFPIASPRDVVAAGSEREHGPAPDAGVEQDLHVPVLTSKGSILSWPTTRFA